ncbi:MAG TPA: site-2 protease family protein [Chthoniobacterales bacterium]
MRRMVIFLFWLLPLLIFLVMGETGVGISPFVVALVLLLLFFLADAFLGRGRRANQRLERAEPQASLSDEQLRTLAQELQPILATKGWKAIGDVAQFDGVLRLNPPEALQHINQTIAPARLQGFLTEGEHGHARVTLVPVDRVSLPAKAPNWGVHVILFLLTFVTTTWAGALHQGVNLLDQPSRFAAGLPYSVGLLLILGGHEFGHYFAARRHRIQVTPPYFIPAPFALGTFGAFINLRGRVPDRRALFDVAVAGPLAGLVFAIPALLVGLRHSRVIVEQAGSVWTQAGVEIGSSFLMAILSKWALGPAAAEGHALLLHPLAFAGWLGLLLTALNLLPIGQLDGGHLAHALFGSRQSHTISVVALFALFALALFVWPGLMMWAFIVYFLAGTRDAPAANDLTPLDPFREVVGCFAFALLALILVPVPPGLYGTFGLHSPYV